MPQNYFPRHPTERTFPTRKLLWLVKRNTLTRLREKSESITLHHAMHSTAVECRAEAQTVFNRPRQNSFSVVVVSINDVPVAAHLLHQLLQLIIVPRHKTTKRLLIKVSVLAQLLLFAPQ